MLNRPSITSLWAIRITTSLRPYFPGGPGVRLLAPHQADHRRTSCAFLPNTSVKIKTKPEMIFTFPPTTMVMTFQALPSIPARKTFSVPLPTYSVVGSFDILSFNQFLVFRYFIFQIDSTSRSMLIPSKLQTDSHFW